MTMTDTPILSTEIEFLKLLGVKPVRVGEDGETEEIEFNDMPPEELQKVYGTTREEQEQ